MVAEVLPDHNFEFVVICYIALKLGVLRRRCIVGESETQVYPGARSGVTSRKFVELKRFR